MLVAQQSVSAATPAHCKFLRNVPLLCTLVVVNDAGRAVAALQPCRVEGDVKVEVRSRLQPRPCRLGLANGARAWSL